MIHKIILLLSLVAAGRNVIAQDTFTFKYEPYFHALIVNNIDSSKQWYQSVFQLKVKNEVADSKNGYRVVILESDSHMVELIEIKSSLNQKKILESKPGGTMIQGHFKVGFKVVEMDKCLSRLASLKIVVPRVWTDPDSRKRNFLISDPDGNLIQFFEGSNK
jgi:hypothetical protein